MYCWFAGNRKIIFIPALLRAVRFAMRPRQLGAAYHIECSIAMRQGFSKYLYACNSCHGARVRNTLHVARHHRLYGRGPHFLYPLLVISGPCSAHVSLYGALYNAHVENGAWSSILELSSCGQYICILIQWIPLSIIIEQSYWIVLKGLTMT